MVLHRKVNTVVGIAVSRFVQGSFSESYLLKAAVGVRKCCIHRIHSKAKMPAAKRSLTKREDSESAPPQKKQKSASDDASSSKKSPKSSGNAHDTPSLVDRRYYPPEMSNERCLEYEHNKIPRPLELLDQAREDTKAQRDKIKVGEAVVHWFKMDLRLQDNHALHAASAKAKENGAALVCLYILSPQDYEAHLTSPVKLDFMLRTLEVVKKDLASLNIPLYCETVPKRKDAPQRILELCSEWKANHLYTNIEYEVDELRRETSLIKLGLDKGISVEALPDTCVVAPGELQTGSGRQFAVYSPYYRAWVGYLHKNPKHLELFQAPTKNPDKAKQTYKTLFNAKIPEAPKSKSLSAEEKKRFASLWPAGEHEARRRLNKFLHDSIGHYSEQRNFPASDATSVLSPHYSSGTLSARSAIVAAQEANSTRKLDGGNTGIKGWISEVAWRDFYKHVLAHWPFICMNKCFKPEYTDIEWNYDNKLFEAWKAGKTGFPIVDAAMRQLRHTGWMHNRCRMIVASFLAKDLLIDWRLGEQFFMTQLVDGDFASNHGGWGFGSSTGVDPQPYFRIFNPRLQSEKFDKTGEYIRKWLPELKDLDEKDIHAPWESKSKDSLKKTGYPEPIVDHKMARDRCLAAFKRGLGRDTA